MLLKSLLNNKMSIFDTFINGRFYIPPIRGCCYVALRKYFVANRYDLDKIARLLSAEEQDLSKFVGKVHPAGTLIIFTTAKTNISVNSKKLMAFALNNYHVGYFMT
jgi:hypothetical protein